MFNGQKSSVLQKSLSQTVTSCSSFSWSSLCYCCLSIATSFHQHSWKTPFNAAFGNWRPHCSAPHTHTHSALLHFPHHLILIFFSEKHNQTLFMPNDHNTAHLRAETQRCEYTQTHHMFLRAMGCHLLTNNRGILSKSKWWNWYLQEQTLTYKCGEKKISCVPLTFFVELHLQSRLLSPVSFDSTTVNKQNI